MEKNCIIDSWMQLKVFRKIQVVVHCCMYSNKHVIYIYILDILPWKYFQQFFIIYFIR